MAIYDNSMRLKLSNMNFKHFTPTSFRWETKCNEMLRPVHIKQAGIY